MFVDRRASVKQDIASAVELVASQESSLTAPGNSGGVNSKLNQFETAWATYQAAITKVSGFYDVGNTIDAEAMMNKGGEIYEAQLATTSVINDLIGLYTQGANDLKAQAVQTRNTALLLLSIVGIGSIVSGLTIGMLISSSITRPLKIYVESLNQLKTGALRRDLSDEVKKRNNSRRDEMGQIGKGLGGTQVYLAGMAELAQKDCRRRPEHGGQADGGTG